MSEVVALQGESNRKKVQSIVKTILFCRRKKNPYEDTENHSIHQIQTISGYCLSLESTAEQNKNYNWKIDSKENLRWK